MRRWPRLYSHRTPKKFPTLEDGVRAQYGCARALLYGPMVGASLLRNRTDDGGDRYWLAQHDPASTRCGCLLADHNADPARVFYPGDMAGWYVDYASQYPGKISRPFAGCWATTVAETETVGASRIPVWFLRWTGPEVDCEFLCRNNALEGAGVPMRFTTEQDMLRTWNVCMPCRCLLSGCCNTPKVAAAIRATLFWGRMQRNPRQKSDCL